MVAVFRSWGTYPSCKSRARKRPWVGRSAIWRCAARLLNYPIDYLKTQIRLPLLPRLLWRLLRRPCDRVFRNVPAHYRSELEAIADCGFDRRSLIAANTLFDMAQMGWRPLFGCSSWVAPRNDSLNRGPLFGRNLDFFPLGYLHDFSLVTIYAPNCSRWGSRRSVFRRRAASPG